MNTVKAKYKKNKEKNVPDVSKEDGQEDGDGVRAVRLADVVLLAVDVEDVVALVLVVVVETENDTDSRDGSEEPEGKVSLAVVVNVVEGAAKEGGLLDDDDGLAVKKGLLLVVAVAVVVGAVVRHVGC